MLFAMNTNYNDLNKGLAFIHVFLFSLHWYRLLSYGRFNHVLVAGERGKFAIPQLDFWYSSKTVKCKRLKLRDLRYFE